MKRTRLTFSISLLVAVLLLASCTSKRRYHIGVSLYHQYSWRQKLAKELEYASFQYEDVQLQILSAENSAEKQTRQIEDYIAEGIDLLIVSPIEDERVGQAIGHAYDKGIPVILVDNILLTDKYTAYIGADNYEIGETVANYVGHTLGGRGRIIEIQGTRGNYATEERHHGFTEALQQFPDIETVASEYANWNDTLATKKTEEILARHNDVDLIFFHTDGMVNQTISRYAKRKTNPIKLVGIDALSINPSGIELVKSGNLTASFVYPTRGDKVFETAIDILHSKPYERIQILPTGLVDRNNLETIMQQHVEIGRLDKQIKAMRDILNTMDDRHAYQRTISLIMATLACILAFISFKLYKTLKRNRQLKQKIEDEYAKKEEQAALLLESNEKLQQLNLRIEEDAQTKLNFFTNISHEIRTPLTLVAGPIEQMLADNTLDPRSRTTLLEICNKNIHILLDLVNDILDFQKVQSGQDSLHIELFNLTQAVSDWTDNFRPTATSHQISLSLSLDERHPVWIEADRKKLTSVFVNLLGNALKNTPDKGHIQVALTTDTTTENHCCLTVSDTGRGISPTDLPHIFDAFYQSSQTKGGTGIGLSLSKQFIDLHGGTISVETKEGVGTTFTVSLPFRQINVNVNDNDNDSGTDNDNDNGNHNADVGRRDRTTILVVDDNDDVRHYISHILMHDYEVITANNGQTGLQQAIDTIPDIILLDVMMPVMDGIDCLAKLKTTTATSHIPVILLTAKTLDEHVVEGYESGADAYITKPFKAKILLSRIENLLAGRRLLHNLWAGTGQDETLIKPRESEFVQRFKAYIDENYANSDLSVEDISHAMNLSRAQLYAKIKALTGRAPVEHLRTSRLLHGRELLLTTDLTVSEVAYSVGFTAPSYFSKCFKDEFNISPIDLLKTS